MTTFRQHYNGCKTYGCAHCGDPTPSLYVPSHRLGFAAWHCPLCGAYPPLLLDAPIVALAEQIASTSFPTFTSPCCPSPHWVRYGKTGAGSARYRCNSCRKVTTLPSAQTLSALLDPLWQLLRQGVAPWEVAKTLGLNNKLMGLRWQKLAALFAQYGHLVQSQILSHEPLSAEHISQEKPLLHTRSRQQSCRSGLARAGNKAAMLWTLTTLDLRSGYVVLISDNWWAGNSDDISANHSGNHSAKNWLEASRYRAMLRSATPHVSSHPVDANRGEGQGTDSRQDSRSDNSAAEVIQLAEQTYQSIFARAQFDELKYCPWENSQVAQGALLRPVFAAHAHMQNLRAVIAGRHHPHLVLEHESFLRGAAITAFSEAVNSGEMSLYYAHCIKLVRTPDSEKTSAPTSHKLSWWPEKWQCEHLSRNGEPWQIGVGLLSPNSQNVTAKALFAQRPDWHQQFWQAWEAWLPSVQAARLSAERVAQWREIFRCLYNERLMPKAWQHNLRSIGALVDAINQHTAAQFVQKTD
uniref:hypothetical protein n=1 Tax=Thaumasiovibrio occultus TaxID=1891184 RepID=UPI000B35EB57|nr:hypothetical protein [Thaumasiovibrio occultus]